MESPDSDGMLAEQLLRLTRRLQRIQSRQLEPIGITPAQFRLLRTTAHYEGAPRMADLAERLDVVPRAVTTLVDGLEASGRVRRAPDPTNRRVVRVEITEEGRAVLRSMRAARKAAGGDPGSTDRRTARGARRSADRSGR